MLTAKEGANVIFVRVNDKQTSSRLVVPYPDLGIVATRHREGLMLVEVETPDWPFVFVKLVDHGSFTVVPQPDYSAVQ